MALDVGTLERSARVAYEVGRARDALLGSIPLAVLAVGAVWLGPERWFGVGVGLLLVATGAFYLWRGMLAARAVVPGVLAGLVPLTLTHLANGYGTVCSADGCSSMCMQACVTGGIVAGLLVVRFAGKQEHRATAWGLGGSMALMTGALGCTCIGYTGVLALVGALFVTSLPALVTWALRPA